MGTTLHAARLRSTAHLFYCSEVFVIGVARAPRMPIGLQGRRAQRLGQERRLRSAGGVVSRGPLDGFTRRVGDGFTQRARDSFARRAHDGSQGLSVPGPRTSRTLSSSSARRADGVPSVRVVGPPGRTTIQERRIGRALHNQGLKAPGNERAPSGRKTDCR